MRVILIDPWNQMITATTKFHGYQDYYRLLSSASSEDVGVPDVTCFDITMVNAPAGHLLVVDDEGMLKDEQAFFQLDGRTFAGRGVLIDDSGGDEDGPATASIPDVEALVRWIPLGSTVSISRPVIRSFDTAEDLLRYLAGD